MARLGDFRLPDDLSLVEELARGLGCALERTRASELAAYLETLLAWNRKIGLTSAAGAPAQVEVLLSDALVLADPTLTPEGAHLVDVGSGAGSPILPLLLLRPDLHAVLVEPRRKRVAFLRAAIGRLTLPRRAQVRETRVDPHAPALDGARFDLALSRATFPPATWLPVGLALADEVVVLSTAAVEPPSHVRQLAARSYTLPSGRERHVARFAPTNGIGGRSDDYVSSRE